MCGDGRHHLGRCPPGAPGNLPTTHIRHTGMGGEVIPPKPNRSHVTPTPSAGSRDRGSRDVCLGLVHVLPNDYNICRIQDMTLSYTVHTLMLHTITTTIVKCFLEAIPRNISGSKISRYTVYQIGVTFSWVLYQHSVRRQKSIYAQNNRRFLSLPHY